MTQTSQSKPMLGLLRKQVGERCFSSTGVGPAGSHLWHHRKSLPEDEVNKEEVNRAKWCMDRDS